MISAWRCDHRRGHRAENQDKGEQRQAQAQEAIGNEARVALSLKGMGREVAGEEKEEAHEIGLIRGHKKSEKKAGELCRRIQLVVEPAAGCAIGDGGMVQDHQNGHDRPQAIDVEIATRCGRLNGRGSGECRRCRHTICSR